METQTYNTHTEEVTAINEQTGDANAEIVAAPHSSDSDFDEEEIPTEITDVISR